MLLIMLVLLALLVVLVLLVLLVKGSVIYNDIIMVKKRLMPHLCLCLLPKEQLLFQINLLVVAVVVAVVMALAVEDAQQDVKIKNI
jgi:hypothetical protein